MSGKRGLWHAETGKLKKIVEVETSTGSLEPMPAGCVRPAPDGRHLAVSPAGSEKVTVFEA